jgi:hypothetical protein
VSVAAHSATCSARRGAGSVLSFLLPGDGSRCKARRSRYLGYGITRLIFSAMCLFSVSKAQFDVPGAVQVNPVDQILDAIGIGDLFSSNDEGKNVVTLWYFWVLIAVAIIFVIVGGYFTYRGCKRWKNVRQENAVKRLVPDAVEKAYFDEATEEYIMDMSLRTGIPIEKVQEHGARHASGGGLSGAREFGRMMTKQLNLEEGALKQLNLEEGALKQLNLEEGALK